MSVPNPHPWHGCCLIISIPYPFHASSPLRPRYLQLGPRHLCEQLVPDGSELTSVCHGRQEELIASICKGLSNDEIARKLDLSPNTVKAHFNRIFKTLNIRRRSKLMALGLDRPAPRSA